MKKYLYKTTMSEVNVLKHERSAKYVLADPIAPDPVTGNSNWRLINVSYDNKHTFVYWTWELELPED